MLRAGEGVVAGLKWLPMCAYVCACVCVCVCVHCPSSTLITGTSGCLCVCACVYVCMCVCAAHLQHCPSSSPARG